MFHYKCLLHNTLINYFKSSKTSCQWWLVGFYRYKHKAPNSKTIFM